MRKIYIDLESYYSADYSLSLMTTREYIMDSRFEVIGASIAIDDKPTRWLWAEELTMLFAAVDWDETQVICQNTIFDGAILAWIYDVHPKFFFDTMGMYQAVRGAFTGTAALKSIARWVGMHKDVQALTQMKGVRGQDMVRDSAEVVRYVDYAEDDTNIMRVAFKRMMKDGFPQGELIIIDTLIRMYIYGNLTLDTDILDECITNVKAIAAQAMAAAGITDRGDLRSRDKFAEKLKSLGVTPPLKISPATGLDTYAFAKNDLNFVALLDSDDPRVRTLVEAKLNASSTLEETRAERFKRLSLIPGAILHVPLKYSAAHTHRFGGMDKLNLQNLPRQSPLRASIVAPPGYKIVVIDASQIEARITAWLAGCTNMVRSFARGDDVYSIFASDIYGFKVNKKEHNDQRFVGKTGILGLGYGAGWKKFQYMLLTSPFYDGHAGDEFCEKVVSTYRTKYADIKLFWRRNENILSVMAAGGRPEPYLGMGVGNCRLVLPTGLAIEYPQLHAYDDNEPGEDDFTLRGYRYYSARYKGWKDIYGASFTENMVQALARTVITNAMIYMRAVRPHYFCALQVHDELAYVVKDDCAKDCFDLLMQFMNTTPKWADDTLPLAAEGGIGVRYADVK